jgi:hypothetical protein
LPSTPRVQTEKTVRWQTIPRNPHATCNGAWIEGIFTNFFEASGGELVLATAACACRTISLMSARWLSILVAAFAVLGVARPSVAAADSADVASTQAYLQTNYTLMRYFTSHIPAAKAEIASVLTGVRRECPLAASGSPQNGDSEQLSNEVVGTMVTTVVQHNLAPALSAIRATEPLRWSNSALNKTIHAYLAKAKALTTLAVPDLCGDVKAWAASGFKTLPTSTATFSPHFLSWWVAPGNQPPALRHYESSQDAALAHRTTKLEEQWTQFEADEVETWGEIMNALVLQP